MLSSSKLKKISKLLQRSKGFLDKYDHGIEESILSKYSDPNSKRMKLHERIESDSFEDIKAVWVLSTGRAGTAMLTRMLDLSEVIDSMHEPEPRMFKFSYDYDMGYMGREEGIRVLSYLRDEYVHESNYRAKTYVETNNRCVYVADLLKARYPNSKFIHIYRDPYKYIISGLRRQYYNGHNCDYARKEPREMDRYHGNWGSMSPIEKIAWNWQAINREAKAFCDALPEGQKMSFSSEEMFKGGIAFSKKIFEFVDDRYIPEDRSLEGMFVKPVNAQTYGDYKNVEDWDKGDRDKVNNIIADVAEELSYKLR